jgi:hypothetical protein
MMQHVRERDDVDAVVFDCIQFADLVAVKHKIEINYILVMMFGRNCFRGDVPLPNSSIESAEALGRSLN